MKFLKSLSLGLLLLPLTLATLFRLPGALLALQGQAESVTLIFCGAVIYVLIEAIFERPMRTYVFGHELTHALASIAMGGKVHSFNVSAKGGSVSLSKSNFIIALAPYCFPIYTFFVLILYWILKKTYPFAFLDQGFLVLVGMTLVFHGSLTLYAVRQEQPDLKKTGTIFSVVFILLVNGWVMAGLSKIMFWHSFAFGEFSMAVVRTQADIWIWAWENLVNIVKFANEKIISRPPGLP